MDIKKIRDDFPTLNQSINGKPIIYFDNACMTLRPRHVIESICEYYNKYPACGGRSVHKLGMEVSVKCDEARETFRKFINAKTNK